MTKRQDPFAKFDDVIHDLRDIREHIGEPAPPVIAKVMDHIDAVSRVIIEKSPFIVMASATLTVTLIFPKGLLNPYLAILLILKTSVELT